MKNNILIPLAFTVFTGTAAGMEKPLKELNKQLIHAAKVGDTDMVAQLLEKQKKEDDEKNLLKLQTYCAQDAAKRCTVLQKMIIVR